jgi:hypothetical protein
MKVKITMDFSIYSGERLYYGEITFNEPSIDWNHSCIYTKSYKLEKTAKKHVDKICKNLGLEQ